MRYTNCVDHCEISASNNELMVPAPKYAEVDLLWLFSLVRPTFEKVCKAVERNYRRIYLTSCTSKVHERIICKQLSDHVFSDNEIISN